MRRFPTFRPTRLGGSVRHYAILLVLICGCSTAPVADLLDYFKPGKLEQGKMAPYGGVCGPQQGGAGAPVAPQALPGAPIFPGSAAGPPLGNPGLQSAPLPPPDFGLGQPAR
jgi:hypothetical protein